MRRKISSLVSRILLFILVPVAMNTCAATGLPFKEVQLMDNGENAILYIYRPKAQTGSAIPYEYILDDKNLVNIKNKGYTWTSLTPGHHNIVLQIWSNPIFAMDFTVEAGKSYYCRTVSKSEFVDYRWNTIYLDSEYRLIFVDEEEALPEISKTRFTPIL